MTIYKCSVVIATFNGSKYIVEQLDSLIHQTRLPDEIIICDDCSTDDTVDVLKKYIAKNKIEFIKFYENPKNLGFAANFIQALKLASFDIVFFCDQDDIWDLHKIEIMMSVFENNNNITALKCQKKTFDDSKKLLPSKNRSAYGLKYISIKTFSRTFDCSGLTFAIHKNKYLEIAEYVEKCGNGYDVLAGFYSSINHSLYSISNVLVYHRLHANNASGSRKDGRAHALKSLHRKIGWLETALTFRTIDSKGKYAKQMTKASCYYKKIVELYEEKRVIKLILTCLFPPKFVRFSYAVSNIIYLVL